MTKLLAVADTDDNLRSGKIIHAIINSPLMSHLRAPQHKPPS